MKDYTLPKKLTVDISRSFPFRSRNFLFPESAITGIPETEHIIVETKDSNTKVQTKNTNFKC